MEENKKGENKTGKNLPCQDKGSLINLKAIKGKKDPKETQKRQRERNLARRTPLAPLWLPLALLPWQGSAGSWCLTEYPWLPPLPGHGGSLLGAGFLSVLPFSVVVMEGNFTERGWL